MKLNLDPPAGNACEIVVSIEAGDRDAGVRFWSESVSLSSSPEAAVVATLLPAMRLGENINVPESISPRLSESLHEVQNIFAIWDRTLKRIAINASGKFSTPCRGERVGTFFSGGVDSLYTLLKRKDEITDLVYIRGFDVKLHDGDLYRRVLMSIERLARTYGKRVVIVETDLHEYLNLYADWAIFTHGAALAATGHVLCEHFRRIYIPSTHTYADLFPWGSHPVLDRLWSSEAVEFVHDGCEARRVDKAELLATSDAALETLRVCTKNTDGAYNCGICEKCVRTQINLLAVDALDRCPTFDTTIDAGLVRSTKVRGANARAFVKENLEVLEQRGIAPDIQRALREKLARGGVAGRVRKGASRISRMLNRQADR